MRVINVVGAFTVLVCNLIVSYNHSIQLFRSGGFHGWMAHVAVVGCEVTFLLGALNLVVSRMKGEPPGWPAILGGLLGVLMVGWSNVSAGWEYGVTGILLGLATPAALVIAESILSRAILQRSKKESATSSQAEEKAREVVRHFDVLEAMEEVATTKMEETTEMEIRPSTETEENTTKVESQATTEVEKVEEVTARMEEPPAELEKSPDDVGESSQEEEEEPHADPAQLEEEPPSDQEENTPRTPLEWAWYLYKQKGELPKRREIMEKAGCKEWAARKAREEVQKRIS